jgi:medium-chain acyl-[acyl-carrier-protein] hydrolase
MASSFQKEFTIVSYELNPRGKARLTAMANYLQEVAYHHANELGFGYDQMKERRTLWMLSRMKIQMFRYPVWNDKGVVETWPSGIDNVFALRDFRIYDSRGEVTGIATTYWLIVHLDTHRPIRPGAELDRYSSIDYGDPVFDSKLEKIRLPGDVSPLGQHTVVFSDLDIQGHVNNVKYLEWSIDASMTKDSLDRAIGVFEINFQHEALLGNHVKISGIDESSDTENGASIHTLAATREEDGKELIRARFTRN